MKNSSFDNTNFSQNSKNENNTTNNNSKTKAPSKNINKKKIYTYFLLGLLILFIFVFIIFDTELDIFNEISDEIIETTSIPINLPKANNITSANEKKTPETNETPPKNPPIKDVNNEKTTNNNTEIIDKNKQNNNKKIIPENINNNKKIANEYLKKSDENIELLLPKTLSTDITYKALEKLEKLKLEKNLTKEDLIKYLSHQKLWVKLSAFIISYEQNIFNKKELLQISKEIMKKENKKQALRFLERIRQQNKTTYKEIKHILKV